MGTNSHTLLPRLLPPLLLILAGVLAYWNSFDGVFVYDDLPSILDNPHIRVLWPLSEAMSLPLWSSATTVDGRPLLSLTFALNHHFLGPEPWGYHLVNLVIHITAGLLLYGIVRRTLELPRLDQRSLAVPSEASQRRRGEVGFRERYAGSGTWLALATAVIWLVHPLQTESVTYIVQRAESLMGMFFLLTLYASLRGFASQESGARSQESGGPPAPGVARTMQEKNYIVNFAVNYIGKLARELCRKLVRSSSRQSSRCSCRPGKENPPLAPPRRGTREENPPSSPPWRGWGWVTSVAGFAGIQAIGEELWSMAGPSRLIVAANAGPSESVKRIRLSVSVKNAVKCALSTLNRTLNPTLRRHPCSDTLNRLPFSIASVYHRRSLGDTGGTHTIRERARTQTSPRANPTPWHLLAILACACGMGVKQTMFSAPLLVILYDHVFIGGLAPGGRGLQGPLSVARPGRPGRGRFYVALFSTWLIVFGIIAATWKESTSDFITISPLRYALTQPLVLLYYLRLAIWPSPLVLSYSWPLEYQWPRIVLPGMVILGMLAVMFRGLWRRTWYGFVAAWFFLILAPTSSIAPMRQTIFEHRMYLSLAAVAVLVVMGAEYAVRKLVTDPKRRALLGGSVATVIVIVFGYLTHARNSEYHDEIGIWQDNLAHQPGSHVAHTNLGYHLRKAGKYAEAVSHLQAALQIDPGRPAAHYNLGRALRGLGRTREAIAHYQQALRADPGLSDAHYDLGNALFALGRHREAVEHYQQAVQLKPDYADAHNNWGVVCQADGRLPEAIGHFEQALRLKPDYTVARENLRKTKEMLKSESHIPED